MFQHLCTSSIFSIAMMNLTIFFRSPMIDFVFVWECYETENYNIHKNNFNINNNNAKVSLVFFSIYVTQNRFISQSHQGERRLIHCKYQCFC